MGLVEGYVGVCDSEVGFERVDKWRNGRSGVE